MLVGEGGFDQGGCDISVRQSVLSLCKDNAGVEILFSETESQATRTE